MKAMANRQKKQVQARRSRERETINFKKMNREVMKRVLERLKRSPK